MAKPWNGRCASSSLSVFRCSSVTYFTRGKTRAIGGVREPVVGLQEPVGLRPGFDAQTLVDRLTQAMAEHEQALGRGVLRHQEQATPGDLLVAGQDADRSLPAGALRPPAPCPGRSRHRSERCQDLARPSTITGLYRVSPGLPVAQKPPAEARRQDADHDLPEPRSRAEFRDADRAFRRGSPRRCRAHDSRATA